MAAHESLRAAWAEPHINKAKTGNTVKSKRETEKAREENIWPPPIQFGVPSPKPQVSQWPEILAVISLVLAVLGGITLFSMPVICDLATVHKIGSLKMVAGRVGAGVTAIEIIGFTTAIYARRTVTGKVSMALSTVGLIAGLGIWIAN